MAFPYNSRTKRKKKRNDNKLCFVQITCKNMCGAIHQDKAIRDHCLSRCPGSYHILIIPIISILKCCNEVIHIHTCINDVTIIHRVKKQRGVFHILVFLPEKGLQRLNIQSINTIYHTHCLHSC